MTDRLDGRTVLTWQQLLDEGTIMLHESGIAEADLDAWYLMAEAFQTDRVHFYLDRARKVSDTRLEKGLPVYRDFLLRRACRVPLQQILGVQEFMGLSFCVNEHVLIPRQDTEKLAELVLKDYPDQDYSLLDMCTGSGCIAISLAVLGVYRRVTAVDISKEALKIAKKNSSSLFMVRKGCLKAKSELVSKEPLIYRFTSCLADEQRGLLKNDGNAPYPNADAWADVKEQELVLIESDMFSNLPVTERYDIIVSNPPYIPSHVIEGLEPEVRDHEPRIALDGTEDGLLFYRILAEKSKEYLTEGGSIYFEIGYDQAEAVSGILLENGYDKIRVIKDEPGFNRVVTAVWQS